MDFKILIQKNNSLTIESYVSKISLRPKCKKKKNGKKDGKENFNPLCKFW